MTTQSNVDKTLQAKCVADTFTHFADIEEVIKEVKWYLDHQKKSDTFL